MRPSERAIVEHSPLVSQTSREIRAGAERLGSVLARRLEGRGRMAARHFIVGGVYVFRRTLVCRAACKLFLRAALGLLALFLLPLNFFLTLQERSGHQLAADNDPTSSWEAANGARAVGAWLLSFPLRLQEFTGKLNQMPFDSWRHAIHASLNLVPLCSERAHIHSISLDPNTEGPLQLK